MIQPTSNAYKLYQLSSPLTSEATCFHTTNMTPIFNQQYKLHGFFTRKTAINTLCSKVKNKFS